MGLRLPCQTVPEGSVIGNKVRCGTHRIVGKGMMSLAGAQISWNKAGYEHHLVIDTRIFNST